MHGLIARALQCFLRDTYGPALWKQVVLDARIGVDTFEPMLSYRDGEIDAVLCAASDRLDRSVASIQEDVGTYLVSHPNMRALRRLLRFSGRDFIDFVHSLEDIPDRARLSVPDLILPAVDLRKACPGKYQVHCAAGLPGFGAAMMGVLRAMADDYGALVVLEREAAPEGGDLLAIDLLSADFNIGQQFDLAAGA